MRAANRSRRALSTAIASFTSRIASVIASMFVIASDSTVSFLEPVNPFPRQDFQMKTICSWCGRVLREGPLPISHGICDDCAVKMEAAS
jgi:hypothetical protein